jgi:predicted nucleic acid-binding protein
MMTRPVTIYVIDSSVAIKTWYDCLHLAFAVRLGGVMMTADENLVNGLAGTPWRGNITRLQDVP